MAGSQCHELQPDHHAVSFEQIRYEVDGAVATITLDRPDRLNAFSPKMRDELLQALDDADADDAVRAVIFTGSGRAFCAGADISQGENMFAYERPPGTADPLVGRERGGTLTLRLFDMKKPLIAAINGAAIGIGATMTLPMDFRIAAAGAKFGFVFARRGLVPEAASSWFLPRLVGIARSIDWTLTGRMVEADEALAAGLVSAVYPADELLGAARQIAETIAANSAPVAVGMARQMLWKMLTEAHPMAAHRIETRAFAALGPTADVREGIAAFREKRPPQFTGSPSVEMPNFYPWWDAPAFDE